MILKFSISRLFSILIRKALFLAVLIVFICLSVASNVHHWIRSFHKCSSLNHKTRGVNIKVGWYSSEHCWKSKILWINAKNDWISIRVQPGVEKLESNAKNLTRMVITRLPNCFKWTNLISGNEFRYLVIELSFKWFSFFELHQIFGSWYQIDTKLILIVDNWHFPIYTF